MARRPKTPALLLKRLKRVRIVHPTLRSRRKRKDEKML
jgi:hypothetical protein